MIGGVYIYPQDTELKYMDGSNTDISGYELPDVLNNEEYTPYVEEELYASTNNVRLYYPPNGENVQYIKNGNHIKVPTQMGYNLYTIDSVRVSTDDGIIQVDAQHYSVNYMRDSAHELAVGKSIETIESINNALTSSKFVSDDFNLVGSGEINAPYVLDGESTVISSLTSATVGSVLVGPNSVLRKYFGQYIRRSINGIEAFEVQDVEDTTQGYPLVLGVNIRDMDYTIDTSNIYTSVIVSGGSIPSIYVKGDRLGGRFKGLGGTKLNKLDDLPLNHTIEFIYKGVPIIANRDGSGIKTRLGTVYYEARDTSSSQGIHGNKVTYIDGRITVIKEGHPYIDEMLDVGYTYAYNYSSSTGADVYESYMGYPKIKEADAIQFVKIEPYMIQVPNRADTTIKGNSVKYVDFETSYTKTEDVVRVFYNWYFDKFKGYWSHRIHKNTLEPTFEAVFTLDDMRTLYGKKQINPQNFNVGDVYDVVAETYQIRFKSVITRTKYNPITGQIIEIEFGNKKDLELEVLKTTNVNKPISQRIPKPPTPSVVRPQTPPKYDGGGNDNEDDEEEEEEEDKPLRNPSDIYIEYREDDGDERVEWANPVIYITPASERSTQLKAIWYNKPEGEDRDLPDVNVNTRYYGDLELNRGRIAWTAWNMNTRDVFPSGHPMVDLYLSLLPKPEDLGNSRFRYKKILQDYRDGMTNNYYIGEHNYAGKRISTQMTLEEWNNYEKDGVDRSIGQVSEWYFYYDRYRGQIVNDPGQERDIHNKLVNIFNDSQLLPIIRTVTKKDLDKWVKYIEGKTVKELQEDIVDTENDPFDKEYLRKLLITRTAFGAENRLRGSKIILSEEQPPDKEVITGFRASTRGGFDLGKWKFTFEIGYTEQRVKSDGTPENVWNFPSDFSTIKIKELFIEPTNYNKELENQVVPGGARLYQMHIPSHPDIRVEPFIIIARGELEGAIRVQTDELRELYQSLDKKERDRFEKEHGTEEERYNEARQEVFKEGYHQSYDPLNNGVIRPPSYVNDIEKAYGKMDKYWEDVRNLLATNGKIATNEIYKDMENANLV